MSNTEKPSFNLWNEPWIGVENLTGQVETLSVQGALTAAQEYRSLSDPSPLTVVGIHRLLVAVLQFIYKPQHNSDLRAIWRSGAFSDPMIDAFGHTYAERFDLFSETEPFFQSADIPLAPGKDVKSVAYLSEEIPSGTAVTHFRHGADAECLFCPACCARGLVVIPAFATSGGSGIKPSINGVPPLYIIPGGRTLFESLAASLTVPVFQPRVASRTQDNVWWGREPLVQRGMEALDVGYLHSLTFAARRVRLHPQFVDMPCTRCGAKSLWGVGRISFEMGEQRPKDAPFWFDPFAAYRISEDKPRPIRPEEGKAAWREFAAMFLIHSLANSDSTQSKRPSVLDQIAALELDLDQAACQFRCVGLRTDMKAKIFEWVEAGFDVPPSLLRDENAGLEVQAAVDFAVDCTNILTSNFRKYFAGSSRKYERNRGVRMQMEASVWSALAAPFRNFVLHIADAETRSEAQRQWAESVIRQARLSFQRALEFLDERAETLSLRVQAEKWCVIKLSEKRKEYLHE